MGTLAMYGLHKRYLELLRLASEDGVSEEQSRLHFLTAEVVRNQLNAEIAEFGKYSKRP